MVVRYGLAVEPGFLPVFSVDTEEEARMLITLTCPMNHRGEYYARELVREQTLEKLYEFGARLESAYETLKKNTRKSP